MIPANVNLMLEENKILEQTVPAFMMFLMMEECRKIGITMRADVMHHLNVASIAPLKELDTYNVAKLARRTDDAARILLHDLSPDDPRHGLYCCAAFCLKLVDEGRITDPKNQAVLVSLLLMDDIKMEHPTEDPVWRLEEQKWHEAAGKMMFRASVQGLFAVKSKCN